MEDIDIAAAPYTPDVKNAAAQYWETNEVNAAAIRTNAINSGAVNPWAGVGYSAVSSALGLETAEALASVSLDAQPLLYDNINTTAFSTKSYDINSEQSWSVLQEITNAWPYYVPKVIGTYFLKHTAPSTVATASFNTLSSSFASATLAPNIEPPDAAFAIPG